MKTTFYQLMMRTGFAAVGADFESHTENFVDFQLLKKSDFNDGKFVGYKLGTRCSINQALKKGILLALEELNISNTKVLITEHRCLIADASDQGFCFAGHQLVYKHFNKTTYERESITWELLEQTFKKANDLTKRSTE